jgi:chromosome segregation ATPase
MVTESADGSELAVTLPTPLDEWLDERAAELDVDREEVLVQLLGAYRAAADLNDERIPGVAEDGELDDRIIDEIDRRVQAVESNDDVDELETRIATLESELEEDIEDVRSRVLQVRDAVKERAAEDHSHAEMRRLSERVDGLSETLEDVGTEVTETTDAVDDIDDRLSDVESKLDRLARVVVALRKRGDAQRSEREEQLDHIKRAANEHGVTEARCDACGESVRISLLTEPACPHCGTEARGIEPPGSLLGRTFDIGTAKLTGVETPALETDDE